MGTPAHPPPVQREGWVPRLRFALWFHCLASDLGLPPPPLDRPKSGMLLSAETSLFLHGRPPAVCSSSVSGRRGLGFAPVPPGFAVPLLRSPPTSVGSCCVCVSWVSSLFVCLSTSRSLSVCPSVSPSASLCHSVVSHPL